MTHVGKNMRSFGKILFVCLAVAGGWIAEIHAEPAAGSKIVSIHVVGQKRYSESQVIAASGLYAGQDFDPGVLETVAQRLGASGAFSDIQYHYRPDGTGTAVELTVQETENLHLYVFDNFVWFTEQQVEDYLRQEVPLFAERLPESGALIDDVAQALQRLLLSKNIDARVEHSQYGGLGSTNWTHIFTAIGPELKIRTVEFQGTQGIDNATLEQEGAPLAGRLYSATECRAFGLATFVPLYRERGYLRVAVGQPVGRVLIQGAAGTDYYDVAVTFPIAEALLYNWKTVEWSGNQTATSTDLTMLLGMKPGEPANGKKIDAGWEAVAAAYGKKGYVEAKITPTPSYDDSSRSVVFQTTIAEGPQYRMGTFTIVGVPAVTAQQIQEKWRLKPPDIYDSSYLHDFLSKDLPSLLAASQIRASTIQSRTMLNHDRLTVDVTIQLK